MLGFEMTDRRPILEGPDTTSNDRRLALERSADALLEAHAAAKAIGDTVLLSLISSALLHVGKQLAKAVIQPFKP